MTMKSIIVKDDDGDDARMGDRHTEATRRINDGGDDTMKDNEGCRRRYTLLGDKDDLYVE